MSFVLTVPGLTVVAGVGFWVALTEWRTSPVFALAMIGAALFGAVGAVAVTRTVFRPQWLGRARDFTRAEPLRGRVAVAGAPQRTYVAGVPVALPPFYELPAGDDVEVEVTPPLADDPDPTRGRIVVAVLAGAPPLFNVDGPV